MKLTLAALLPLGLYACASYGPPDSVQGMTREQVMEKMGQPERELRVDGQQRLEYPRGPMGHHTWFVYLDPAGHVVRTEQVLTEQNFMRITPDMPEEQLRNLLGRPSNTFVLGRQRGSVWSYRFQNTSCVWFQVELTAEHQVRSTGYSTPPECDARDSKPDS